MRRRCRPALSPSLSTPCIPMHRARHEARACDPGRWPFDARVQADGRGGLDSYTATGACARGQIPADRARSSGPREPACPFACHSARGSLLPRPRNGSASSDCCSQAPAPVLGLTAGKGGQMSRSSGRHREGSAFLGLFTLFRSSVDEVMSHCRGHLPL